MWWYVHFVLFHYTQWFVGIFLINIPFWDLFYLDRYYVRLDFITGCKLKYQSWSSSWNIGIHRKSSKSFTDLFLFPLLLKLTSESLPLADSIITQHACQASTFSCECIYYETLSTECNYCLCFTTCSLLFEIHWR